MLPYLIPVLLATIAAAVAGRWLLRREKRRRRIEFWRGFLEMHTRYRVGECLGLGREGVVYRAQPKDGEAAGCALKVMDACDALERNKHVDLLGRIERARVEAGLAEWPSLPRIYEWGILRAEGREAAYEAIEFIEGETLRQAVASGSVREWTLDERLGALDDLLTGLETLRQRQLMFVHIDLDNVMLGKERKLKLIDLAGFQTGKQSPKAFQRTFRRQARTIQALLGDQWPALLADGRYPAASELYELLSLYEKLPKDARPPAEKELLSFEALRQRIATCLPRAEVPAEKEAPDARAIRQG
jgi:serine/threonine protein kinase